MNLQYSEFTNDEFTDNKFNTMNLSRTVYF